MLKCQFYKLNVMYNVMWNTYGCVVSRNSTLGDHSFLVNDLSGTIIVLYRGPMEKVYILLLFMSRNVCYNITMIQC